VVKKIQCEMHIDGSIFPGKILQRSVVENLVSSLSEVLLSFSIELEPTVELTFAKDIRSLLANTFAEADDSILSLVSRSSD